MSSAMLSLLVCYLVLGAHSGARPMERSLFEGPRLTLDGLLSDESAQALLYFLKERFQRGAEEGDPHLQLRLTKGPLPSAHQDLSPVLSLLQTLFQEAKLDESPKTFLEVFSDRLKREDPPISIDLTFHILRQMIEIAKMQNQKQQAEQNRIILDSVGK